MDDDAGQATVHLELYHRAATDLAAAAPALRVAAAHTLGLLARDEPPRWFVPVADVLCAHLRGRRPRAEAAAGEPFAAELQVLLDVLARLERPEGIDAPFDLRATDLRGARLEGAGWRGSGLDQNWRLWLPGLLADRADLRGADLSGADLSVASLRGAELSGAFFTGADLTAADLRGARLVDAKLAPATLADADLTGADLSGADVGGCDFSAATLVDATLTGTDFWAANLRRADLTGARLNGTNLQGADLRGARITPEQLATAKGEPGFGVEAPEEV